MRNTINYKLTVLSTSLISILIIVIGLSYYTIDLLKGKDSVNKSMYYLTESYKSFMIFSEERNIINKEYFEFSIDRLNKEITKNSLLKDANLSKLLVKYDSLFKYFCNLNELRGLNENLGIEGDFRQSAHDLEFLLSNKELELLQVDLLQIRRREKDFLMRQDPVYVSMVNERISKIKLKVKKSKIEKNLKFEIIDFLENYQQNFLKIVGILDSINITSNKIKLVQKDASSEIGEVYSSINLYADKVINFIITFFILSIFIVIYLANRLSKSIREPILKLSKTVQNINSNNFSLRAKIFSNDEMGDLALSFNKMLDKIEQAYKHVEETNQNLENTVQMRTLELSKEIEERKVFEIKLQNALDNLCKIKDELDNALTKEKELNNLKSRFVSMISHEYRTPLTVIMTSTYLLEKYFELGDSENFKKKMGNVHSAIESMKVLLEDTLTLDKFESGKINTNKVELDVISLLKIAKSETEILMKKNQRIQINSSLDSIPFESDPVLLKHIFSNLYSNAIKYSPIGSDIFVNIFSTNEKIKIEFIDEGIGIPKENIDNIFSPFYRAENVSSIQGTGLGLSIVKKFVDILKGEIGFRNNSDKGTTFYLIFNKSAA